MLLCKATTYGAGCILCGDYWDLRSLYDTVGLVVGARELPQGLDNLLGGFAHDLRTAYSEGGEVVIAHRDKGAILEYRGVRNLWPSYLFTVALLRSAAAWATMTKQDQANLAMLEASTHGALTIAGADSDAVLTWIGYFCPSDNYLVDWVIETNHRYVYGHSPRKRIARLHESLLSMFELSAEYQEFEVAARRSAMRHDCQAHQLTLPREWAPFRW
jgi:hypothetical protein